MKVESMEQFGKAVDDGYEFEVFSDKCQWVDIDSMMGSVMFTQGLIQQRHLRTKPKTTKLYEIANITEISTFMWVSNTNGYKDKLTGRTAIATIEDKQDE